MRRVFLVGYMGAGKTTVGRLLAKRAGLTFIDLDHYIEGRYHKAVPAIFAEKGEEAFRDMERRMLHEVAEFEDVLISTGGGAPCFFDNMAKVSVEELANRLEVCKQNRPVLKNRSGEELRAFIRENLEKRLPFYSQASVIFDAEKMLTEHDAREIAEALRERLALEKATE